MESPKRKFWQQPWGYGESFIIAFSLFFLGFIIELISHKPISPPSFPYNLIVILIFLGYIIFTSLFIKHPFLRWLSSIPATLSVITVFTILVLLMGFVPQEKSQVLPWVTKLGLSHINKSWPYFLVAMMLLTVLGYTMVRRARPFTLRNMAFLMNHGGLWLVVVAASLGSSDLWRLKMQLFEGSAAYGAYDEKGNAYSLNFAIKLLDFKMEEYYPELVIYDKVKDELKIKKGDKLLELSHKQGKLNEWNIKVIQYLPLARFHHGNFEADSSIGSYPAVFIEGENSKTKQKVSGWVASGNSFIPYTMLPLDEKTSIAMTLPKPKKFSSKLRMYSSMTDFKDVELEVNHPIKFKGWKIYQVGYNEEMGQFSNESILEIVRDPWINVIYLGIFMLLSGSVYLFWMGSSRKS